MKQLKLNQLSVEERQLIPLYLEKWREIFSRSGAIDRQGAAELVCSIYKVMDLGTPKFLFYDSPLSAMEDLLNNWDTITPEADVILWYPTWDLMFDPIMEQMEDDFGNQMGEELWANLDEIILNSFGRLLKNEIRDLSGKWLTYSPDLWKYQACLYDFCISVPGFKCNLEYWQLFQALVTETGWIYPFPKVCLVCDRPIKLLLDTDNRLHADKESALEFADDFHIYANHGVRVESSRIFREERSLSVLNLDDRIQLD